MKTKTNIDLGDCLATSSQPAVHSDSFTVDEGDVADHEPFACGDHAQIESGNLNQTNIIIISLFSLTRSRAYLQHSHGYGHESVHFPLAAEVPDMLVEYIPLGGPRVGLVGPTCRP